jgi:hypothetical protein
MYYKQTIFFAFLLNVSPIKTEHVVIKKIAKIDDKKF